MIPVRDDTPRYSTPYVMYFIIALNVVVFLFELAVDSQGPRALNSLIYEFGVVPRHFEHALAVEHVSLPALFLPTLTSMFLHGGWMHLIGNMWFLWIFGDNVEDRLGHFRYLLTYLVCGFGAALTHLIFNLHSRIPTVGASGAIAGVLGAYFLLFPSARVLTWFFIFVMWLPAWLVLGYWFVIQFLSGAASTVSSTTTNPVAFWAHVGGFITGMLLVKTIPLRKQYYAFEDR
jgi:membrane associated rhomboid family serine protease